MSFTEFGTSEDDAKWSAEICNICSAKVEVIKNATE